MSFFSDMFGSSSTRSDSKTESTTLTNTGSGLAASGNSGSIVFNDPHAAIAALDANAYTVNRSMDTVEAGLGTVDKAVKANSDLSQNALSGALKAVGDTVTSASGLLSKTQQLYYEKIADNAGVAPQTLQQQQQAASADITKTIALAGAFIVGLLLLSRNDVTKTALQSK